METHVCFLVAKPGNMWHVQDVSKAPRRSFRRRTWRRTRHNHQISAWCGFVLLLSCCSLTFFPFHSSQSPIKLGRPEDFFFGSQVGCYLKCGDHVQPQRRDRQLGSLLDLICILLPAKKKNQHLNHTLIFILVPFFFSSCVFVCFFFFKRQPVWF